MAIVYLNGEWLDESEAKVSVLDRGFLFADAVYEVIPAYASNFFRFEEHVERLKNSLRQIKLDMQVSADELQAIGQKLLALNKLENASFYLQISRGAYAGRSHEMPEKTSPTVLAMVSALPAVDHDSASQAAGIKVITLDDIRWHRCDIKTTGLLANCLLLQQALESGADDSILVRDGKAIEATASNLFMVTAQKVITPPLDKEILAGVTRDFVIMLVKKLGYELIETEITVAQLAAADEIWLTSSNKEIRPVVELNHVKIGDGKAGEVWQRVNSAYQKLKYELYQGQLSEIEGV